MKYAGMIKQSLVDYPGEIASVLFTRTCNLRCPFCHNPDLLFNPKVLTKPTDIEEVLEFLSQRRGFLDGVVISGGEPTLHEELPIDIGKIKSLGMLVKLDTNGTNPAMLERLLRRHMVDYVAMDIKAPLEYKRYLAACGRLSSEDFFQIRGSLNLLRSAHTRIEFRTTVVPVLHTPEDVVEIAKSIQGSGRYTLQQYNPKVTLDRSFGAVVPYSKAEMQSIADLCAPWVEEVAVVNL